MDYLEQRRFLFLWIDTVSWKLNLDLSNLVFKIADYWCVHFIQKFFDFLERSFCFLHRYQRWNVTMTDRAKLICFDKFISTVIAHLEMTARHFNTVFFLLKTDQAHGIYIFFLVGIFANWVFLLDLKSGDIYLRFVPLKDKFFLKEKIRVTEANQVSV